MLSWFSTTYSVRLPERGLRRGPFAPGQTWLLRNGEDSRGLAGLECAGLRVCQIPIRGFARDWSRSGIQSLASGLRLNRAVSERLNRLGNKGPNRSRRQGLFAGSR
jgi:hypothetical protein